jgi:competence protein ComEC
MHPPESARTAPVPVAPLVPLALAVAAGIVADRYGGPWGTSGWLGLAIGLGVVGLVAAWWWWVGVLAVVGAWGALAGGWHHYRWSDLADDDLARGVTEAPRPVWVRGVIRDGLGYRPGRGDDDKGVTRAVVDLTAVNAEGRWRKVSGRAVMTVEGDRTDLRAGTAVEAAGGLGLVPGPLNPGEFDYRAYMRAQGVRLRLTVDDSSGVWRDATASAGPFDPARAAARWLGAVRAWSQERLARGLDPAAAPLASALVLGRREGVDPDVNDAFARTGTTHLLAISGLHMQVLALALGGLLRVLGVGRRATFAAVGVATVAYTMLVGLMPSVVRSAAMTATYCVAGLSDRRGRAANTLAMAALVTLGLNPAHLFDVGCQLSFLAVGAIVWAGGPAAAWAVPATHPDPLTALERRFEPGWKRLSRRAGAWVVQAVVISTVVWLAALPLVALRFHLVSPVGVVLNLPLIPMTSLALLASGVSLGLSAVWEPLGRPSGWLAAWLLRWTERVVRSGAAWRWGHAFVPEPAWGWVLGFYLLLGLAAAAAGLGRWRGPASGLLAAWAAAGLGAAVVPLVTARPGGPTRAEVLAVGHGLAVLIETGGGRAVLYDCGRMRDPSVGRRVVAPALWARGVRRLDAVVLSHADADHYDGLPDLLDRLPVAAVLVPPGFAGASNPGAAELLALVRSRGVAVRTVAAGATWSAGMTRFAVLGPPADFDPTASDNARSVVLDVSCRDRHALLTGDLDGAGLAALVGHPPAGPIDALLAPHHGGRTANPSWLYAWADPALVVVSQRPPPPGSRDALAPLEARDVPVLRTWRRGAVRLTWTEDGIKADGFLDREKPSADEPDR